MAVHVPGCYLLLRAYPYQGSYCACVEEYTLWQFMSRSTIFSFVPILTKLATSNACRNISNGSSCLGLPYFPLYLFLPR